MKQTEFFYFQCYNSTTYLIFTSSYKTQVNFLVPYRFLSIFIVGSMNTSVLNHSECYFLLMDIIVFPKNL